MLNLFSTFVAAARHNFWTTYGNISSGLFSNLMCDVAWHVVYEVYSCQIIDIALQNVVIFLLLILRHSTHA